MLDLVVVLCLASIYLPLSCLMVAGSCPVGLPGPDIGYVLYMQRGSKLGFSRRVDDFACCYNGDRSVKSSGVLSSANLHC